MEIDRRLQVFDLPPTEALTRDRQGRTVDKTIAVGANESASVDSALAVSNIAHQLWRAARRPGAGHIRASRPGTR